MKKVYIVLLPLILASLCACIPKTPEPETTEPTTAIIELSTSEIQSSPNDQNSMHIDELYKSYLRNYKSDYSLMFSSNSEEFRYYATFDIDGNGTEELLLGEDTQRDMGIVFIYVFTIRDGKVEKQDLMAYEVEWARNEPILYKDGTIRIGGKDDEYVGNFYMYYRFEDGVLKRHTSIGYEANEGSYRMCRDFSSGILQETTITKEEYDRVQKEMEGDGQVVKLDWKPVTDYTVTQPEE